MILSIRISIFLLSLRLPNQHHEAIVVQLVNDAPIPNPQSVSIAALQFLQIVVRSVRICRKLFDFRHNPSLPTRRQLGKGLVERLRHDDAVHGLARISHRLNPRLRGGDRAKSPEGW
jgi:hypothetical protein